MDKLKELIGTNLKFYRVKAKISQTELADAAGVSRRILQATEAGEHNITLDVLLALSGALKAPIKNIINERRLVFQRGIKAFDALDWKDGGAWSYGVRDMAGVIYGVSESCEKVTGLKLIIGTNQAEKVTLIDENTMILHAPGGDKIMSILRVGILGADYAQLGWLSYGYKKCSVNCLDQICAHILNVIMPLQ